MNIKELQNLTVKQLQAKATELGISEYIGLKKQELIKLILDKLLKYDFKIDYKQMNNIKKNIQFNKDYVEYLFCR